jgi:hypothetical protein
MRRWEREKEHSLENYLPVLIKYLFLVSKNSKTICSRLLGQPVVFSHIRGHTMYICAEEHNFPLVCTLTKEDIDHFAIIIKIICQ